MCIKVLSVGGATYIIGEIIAKDNLNIANLMQTFENLLLWNYSTEFVVIVLWASVHVSYVQMVVPPRLCNFVQVVVMIM